MRKGSDNAKSFFEQFAKPEALLGAIAGRMMAKSNLELNRWTISLLDIGANDNVFEIGFGPGVGIALAAEKATHGFVAGIDPSDVMLRQACKRNATAITAGKVDLRLGDVKNLPDFGRKFHKVFAVNTVPFWPAPAERLAEIRLVMKPDALIALTVQPRTKGATDHTTEELGHNLVKYLKQAGFADLRMEGREMKPVAAVCALGICR